MCKSNFTHGIYIKSESITKSTIFSKLLLKCRWTLKRSCRVWKTIHFCFLDHLHLSTGLKVASPFQWGPYFPLNLQVSPWFSSYPFFFLAPLPPLLCSWRHCRRCSTSPLAAVVHPPALPCPRVTPLLPHRSSFPLLAPCPCATVPAHCQHRTPELLPPPQNPRGQALSPPLFCSMAPAARHHCVCL
jgi:hypothetical protein